MNKVKLFLENIFVYGFGSVISKIIPIIMVPIITRLMPNSTYFGINDMFTTIVSFASAFAVMGMYDAMFRIFFEKDDLNFKKQVCSTTVWFTFCSSLVVAVLLVIFRKSIAELFFNNRDFDYLVCICGLSVLIGSTNTIISAPTRMQNKRKIFLVTNTLSPILSYSVAIPLLLKGFYILALPLATIISIVIMEITFFILNRQWFAFHLFDKKILKELLIIGLPLLPNFIIYWIFNSCDKLMITNILGIDHSGIYAVGSKLGHASQILSSAFGGGWLFFAFSTMKEDNQVRNNSVIFEYMGIITFIATMCICIISYPLYKFLFVGDYVDGFIIAPYLFLGPLLLSMYQIISNQFMIIKKTWPNMFILGFGAFINILLNFLLIPKIGIEGAALATLLGYVASLIFCSLILLRLRLFVVSLKFLISTLAFLAFVISWRLFFMSNILISLLFLLLISVFYIYLYKKELTVMILQLKNKKEE